MPDPTRLAVDPALLAAAGRRFSELLGDLDTTAAHLRGPQPAPPIGDPTCAMAYQDAQHEVCGVVTTAIGQGRALAGALAVAALAYAELDRTRLRIEATDTGADHLASLR